MAHAVAATVRLLGLGPIWLSAACSGVGPAQTPPLREGDRPPAVLAFYGDTGSIELPGAARVGEAVLLRFSTFGGSCVRPGTIDVAISGLRAEVRPYLEEPPAELPDTVVCTAELRMDWRVARLRFERPGRATIRILGLAVPEDRTLVLQRHLQVAP